MKQKAFALARTYPFYALLLIAFSVVYIFVGFVINVSISHWTLPVAFVIFNAVCLLLIKLRSLDWRWLPIFMAVTIVLFFVFSWAFGHTYDVSYDGEQYQQTGVIALAKGWNPIRSINPPIRGEDSFTKSLIVGSPKAIWSLDAAVYKLSGNINSATALNALVALAALAICFFAIRALGLGLWPAALISLGAVLTQILADQIFSFRQDGLSYELLLIGIATLLLSIKSGMRYRYLLSLAAVLLLLSGSKFTNAYVVVPLLLVTGYFFFRQRRYRQPAVMKVALGLAAVGFVVLFNPYISNTIRFGAPDYPYNQTAYDNFTFHQDTSANIRSDNRAERLFYGVFSAPSINYKSTPLAYAKLEYPFSLTPTGLFIESTPASKVVGGYGPLFSGILVVTLATLAYMALASKTTREKSIVLWTGLTVLLIIAACLADPVSNYARYNAELELAPTVVAAALLLLKPNTIKRYISYVLLGLVGLNILIMGLAASSYDLIAFSELHQQLTSLRSSGRPYAVSSPSLYANYTTLAQAGINIRSTNLSNCSGKLIYLTESFNKTLLCPLHY